MKNKSKTMKKTLRYIIGVGNVNSSLLPKAEKTLKIDAISDLEKINHDLLKADIIFVDNTLVHSKGDVKTLKKYLHEAGEIHVKDTTKELEKLFENSGCNKLKGKNVFYKSTSLSPKEYDDHYLARWGNTDFLKNWKIAGEQILNHLPKHVSKKTVKVLDVGCLNGYIMESLRLHGVKHIYGTDISHDIAIKNQINLYHLSAITVGDFTEDQYYPDNYFDMTICMEVLEHVPPRSTDAFVKQLARVTNDNGIVLISASEDWNADPTHVNCRKRDEWYEIFERNGLFAYGKQVIFPGFNSFVLSKNPTSQSYLLYRLKHFIKSFIKM